MILCLGLAALAAEIGLAAIIGALIAGLIVAETKDQSSIEEEIAPLYAFFPPFFFAFIGTQVDLDTLADPGTLGLLAIVTALRGRDLDRAVRGYRRDVHPDDPYRATAPAHAAAG